MKLTCKLIMLLLCCSPLSAQVYEHDIYENLNIAATSGGGSAFNNSVVDFLPFDLNEISTLKRYTVAGSFRFDKGGVKYGRVSSEGVVSPARTTLENIDFIKSALLIYGHRPDFHLFAAYSTPYKFRADVNLETEVVKREDVVSAGILSAVGKNSIVMTMDFNWSDYQEITSRKTIQQRAWGLSNRLALNLQTGKYTSVTAGVTSPVYSINKLDDQGDERLYFNKMILNAVFKYDDKQFMGSYGATYREFNTFVYQDGEDKSEHINHPWLIEHKFMAGYHINNGVRFLMDYQLQPSVYIRPAEMNKIRHSIGIGLLYRYNNSYWNFYGSDSRLFSDDTMERTFFQMDVGYTF